MKRANKKPATYGDPAVRWLSQLSKQALIDTVIDMMRASSGCCDDPITIEAARDSIAPVLERRGDRIPRIAS